jgi:uncharacterized delta-60 repeat protein
MLCHGIDAGFMTSKMFNSIRALVVCLSALVIITIGFELVLNPGVASASTNPGAIDSSFNANGVGADGAIYQAIEQTDGKIVVVGAFRHYNGVAAGQVARLNRDGSLDSGFNVGGTGANAGSTFVSRVAMQNDGKLIISGSFTQFNGVNARYLTRLNADGTLDSTFNQGGSGPDSNAQGLEVQPDGKLLVSGAGISSYNGVSVSLTFRLNSNGALDMSFNNTGNEPKYSFAPTANGNAYYAAGDYLFAGGNQALTRINTSNGSRDNSFTVTFPGYGSLRKVQVLSDGNLIVAGGFQDFGGVSGLSGIVWLQPSGALVSNAQVGITSSGNTWVNSFAVLPSGGVIAGGHFSAFGGITAGNLIGLLSTGAVDRGFNAGSGVDDDVNTIVALADGHILVTGWFTHYDGTAVGHLVKLQGSYVAPAPTPTNSSSTIVPSLATTGAPNAWPLAWIGGGMIILGAVLPLVWRRKRG